MTAIGSHSAFCAGVLTIGVPAIRPSSLAMPLQVHIEKRKADLAVFKERAVALERAVHILDEGIASSRAQVSIAAT